jgi:hypothetical protein
VTLNDTYNTPVSGKPVTLTAGSGSSTITTVNGTTNSSGQATFTVKDSTAQSVTYTAKDTLDNVTVTQTAAVAFYGSATKLVFTTQPGNGTGGSPLSPQPVVTVEDANGNTVTSSTAAITIAISSDPGGGTLSGTKTVNAVGGVATFTNLSVNKIGSGFNLLATGSSFSVYSSNFNVTAGPAAQMTFTTEPYISTSGGNPFPTQPVVTLEDAGGNTASGSSAPVALSITSGTGTTGAALSCNTNPLNASAGVATFAGCSINLAGTGYTLTASTSGLTSIISTAITITVGPATHLGFLQQPTNTLANAVITPAVTVQALDAGGNVVNTGYNITVAIGNNPGSGTLSGTLSRTISGGVATFNNLKINNAGTGYTLTASGGGLTGVTSSPFNIQDFSISASPATLSFKKSGAGNSAQSTITVTSLSNFSALVGLTCAVTPTSGAPTCALIPTSVTPPAGSNATSTVTLTGTGTSGSFTATITGNNGSLSHQVSISLTVNP